MQTTLLLSAAMSSIVPWPSYDTAMTEGGVRRRRSEFIGEEHMKPILTSTILCGTLACISLCLAAYRKLIASKDDPMLHVVDAEAKLISQQHAIADRLDAVDRWGIAITALAVAFGVVAGVLLLVTAWQNGMKLNY